MARIGKLSGGSLRGRRYPQQDTVCKSFFNTSVLPASLTLPCTSPSLLLPPRFSLVTAPSRAGGRLGTPRPASSSFVRTPPSSSVAHVHPRTPLGVAVPREPASPLYAPSPHVGAYPSGRLRQGRTRPPLSPAAAQARATKEASHRLSFLSQQGAGAAFDFLHSIDLRDAYTGPSLTASLELPRSLATDVGKACGHLGGCGFPPSSVLGPTCMPLPMAAPDSTASSRRALPSQQVGFLRAAMLIAGVCSAVTPWEKVKMLVDSGSQQPPLMSQSLAQRLQLSGPLVASAAQANGDPLPIYKVGPVDLSVNGRPSSETFFSAPIHPYDVILGESWLVKHRGVLDYSRNELFSRGADDFLRPLVLDVRPGSDAGQAARDYLVDNAMSAQTLRVGGHAVNLVGGICLAPPLAPALAPTVVGGGLHGAALAAPWWHEANVSALLQPSPEQHRAAASLHRWVDTAVQGRALSASEQRVGPALQAPALPPTSVGARASRAERRQLGLMMMKNFAKELPEDDDIELEDVPGLSAPSEGVANQFALVEAEVRKQLQGSAPAVIEAILTRLRVFEGDVFETRTMPRLPPERLLDLEINLKPGAVPPNRRPYKVAPQHVAELQRQIGVLLDAGIIRRSLSQYGAPVLFAPKKDGRLRLCVDYRALNSQTIRDRFPTPTAQDLIARTKGAKLFSKIDLHSGFHQLNIRPQDRHKTAFVTPEGHYEFVSSPFGLSSTPSAFQRLMTHVLHDHIVGGYCVVFCDDICIFTRSDDPIEHLAKVESILQSLREHQLLAKGSKTELFHTHIEFLGFMLSADGVAPLRSKVEAVLQVPAPETVRDLRSFLGMCNFFAAHLPAFSERAAVLTDLLKGVRHGRQRLEWSLECEHAFLDLKDALTRAPVLRHFDPTLRTAIHVDASTNAVGAVLLQWEEGDLKPRPVAFLSRKLSGAQYRYDSRNVEALAAQVALSEWRHLLYGIKFEVYSDHGSLQYLFTQKEPSQRILRMCEFMADFDFDEIKFVRGVDNVVPDFFSRPRDTSVLDNGLHLLSHPRLGRISGLAALKERGHRVVVLPVAGDQIGVRLSDPDVDGAPIFDVFTRRVEAGTEAAETAQMLLSSMFGGLTAGALTQVGDQAGVSFWRFQCCHPPPFASAWSGVGRWVLPATVPRFGLRSSWRRFAFDSLRFLGVQGRDQRWDGILPASVAAICSMSMTDSSSLLTDISAAIAGDAFLAPIRDRVQQADAKTWRDFSFTDTGVLCYRRASDSQPRVCVPAQCRAAVLQAAHGGSLLVGHPGVDRCSALVARFFYWPSLHRDVAHFVRSCRICAGAKSSTHLRLGAESFSAIPVQPFSSWALDLVGPLPPSRSGNDMFMTWVDRTSKMIVAQAFKSDASSANDLAALTFKEICCRFGLPVSLTHDNDVRFRSGLWKHLWELVGTKLCFTSSYNPQSDPAERANRQVLEALRAAVSSVTNYDEWDTALPEICFSLNSQVSSATGVSPFELAHGFPPRVPLNVGLSTPPSSVDKGAAALALRIANRHRAAADHAAAAQVRIGHLLAKRSSPAEVKVGDLMWLDGAHVPHQVSYKLANRWFGPYPVLAVHPGGATVKLDLPDTLGKTSDVVNLRRLKFFEQRDADLGVDDSPLKPLIDPLGVERYEISRILGHRVLNRRPEYWVEWSGYDMSHNQWVHRDVLEADVPVLLAAYDANPTLFSARKSAPKRATTGRQLPSPPASLPSSAAPRRRPPFVPPPASAVPGLPSASAFGRQRRPPVRLRAGAK